MYGRNHFNFHTIPFGSYEARAASQRGADYLLGNEERWDAACEPPDRRGNRGALELVSICAAAEP
jgi:hypothetical protein